MSTSTLSSKFVDDFEETLKCGICMDTIYCAAICSPCCHSFCGKCLSDWHSKLHRQCPTCSQYIEKVHKNHFIESQVELFWKTFPEKEKTADDKEEWKLKNTIKYDTNFSIVDQLQDTIIQAIEMNDLVELENLINKLMKPSDLNEIGDLDMTTLMWACFYGQLDCLKLIIEKGADLNIRDSEGCTAIMIAADKGHSACVEHLCLKSAALNLKNNIGCTPLMIACNKGDEAIVRILCQHGADVNVKHGIGYNALVSAACKGHRVCIAILLEYGADPNAFNDEFQNTVLIYLSQRGYFQCVSLLCDKGVDVNAKNLEGNTALLGACYNGHPEVVNILCNHKSDLNIKNEYGVTALILACHKGHIECVLLLCSHGADLSIKDREGSTALIIATRKNHIECVVLLLQYMNMPAINLTNKYGKSAYDYASSEELKELYLKHFNQILYTERGHFLPASHNSSSTLSRGSGSAGVLAGESSCLADTAAVSASVLESLSVNISESSTGSTTIAAAALAAIECKKRKVTDHDT